MDGLFLHAPVAGVLIRKVAVAKFTRTLSTMLDMVVDQLGIHVVKDLRSRGMHWDAHDVEKADIDTARELRDGIYMVAPWQPD